MAYDEGMTYRRIIASALLAFGLSACTPAEIRAYLDDTPPSTCTEDMACWDCEDMGNHICGPDAPAWMRDGDPTTGYDAP